PTPNTSSQTLGELLQSASSAGQFRILAQAVQAAGVGGTLAQQGGQFTILAPTDAAFNALPPGTLNRLLQPQNRRLLARVLAYHVVPGRVTSSQLRTGAVRTLGGGVAVRVTPQRIVVNDGSVVTPDIQARNGVIHGVSRVLMSRELRNEIARLR
ncbi:MAG: fasciclin domain-containing protein, partial [Microcoleus sp. SIO2G3]|nr:fasciclin domain-containing protein [Microcoleus sp. SIO2G3]